jgi:DNA-binding CsgD family transcriptional regulator
MIAHSARGVHRATGVATMRSSPVVRAEFRRRAQVAPLIARAHQLSQRKAEIALLVLRGLSTSEIAAKLFISGYTVQDHLKSIFEGEALDATAAQPGARRNSG